jgi:hypothetical protein
VSSLGHRRQLLRANGEPVSATNHAAHGMMSLSGSPLGHQAVHPMTELLR